MLINIIAIIFNIINLELRMLNCKRMLDYKNLYSKTNKLSKDKKKEMLVNKIST